MSATNAPFGLIPVSHANGGLIRPRMGTIASGYATDIYLNSPIKMGTDGTLQAVSGTEAFVGVFAGCSYIDANGIPQFGRWIASTTVLSGSEISAYYYDDAGILYRVQADGSVAQTAIGEQANLSNIGGSGQYATCTMSATTSTGALKQLQIRGLYRDPANAWGDSYTVVTVSISNHQLYPAANGF